MRNDVIWLAVDNLKVTGIVTAYKKCELSQGGWINIEAYRFLFYMYVIHSRFYCHTIDHIQPPYQ